MVNANENNCNGWLDGMKERSLEGSPNDVHIASRNTKNGKNEKRKKRKALLFRISTEK